MATTDPYRLAKAVQLEQIAIVIRYFGFAGVAILIMLGTQAWNGWEIFAIGVMFLVHNLAAQAIIWQRREEFFLSAWNLVIYMIEISIAVRFSGGDESDAWVVYVLALIGYSAYSRSYTNVLRAGFAFSTAYVAVLLWEYWASGSLRVEMGALMARVLLIALSAWLVSRVAQLLHRAEEEAAERAEAYAESDALQRAIFDNTDDPIVVYTDRMIIESANKPACEFLGEPYGKLRGRRLQDFIFDDGTLASKAEALQTEGELEGEQLVLTSEGEEKNVRFVTRSFQSGERQYFVALVHDVTREREIEEARSLAVERLESLTLELKTLDELKSGLITATAANLRSPLGPLLGQLESLLNGELGQLTSEQLRALQGCRRSAKRILRAVEEAFSRSESPAKSAEDSNEPAHR